MPTVLPPAAELRKFQILNRYTAEGVFEREVQVVEISGPLASLSDYTLVHNQPTENGQINPYCPKLPAPVYRVRAQPILTPQQRCELEHAVWAHTPADTKGTDQGQRSLLARPAEGAGLVLLSALTPLQLLDRLPAAVKPRFVSYYRR